MRILKPEVAKERKEKILRWVVQQFVENRRPVGKTAAPWALSSLRPAR